MNIASTISASAYRDEHQLAEMAAHAGGRHLGLPHGLPGFDGAVNAWRFADNSCLIEQQGQAGGILTTLEARQLSNLVREVMDSMDNQPRTLFGIAAAMVDGKFMASEGWRSDFARWSRGLDGPDARLQVSGQADTPADLAVFRESRANSPVGEAVRKHLKA